MASLDGWREVGVGEDGAVIGNDPRADVWRIRATAQDIEVDALGAERECRARLHLSHHLQRVPSLVETGHREVEAAVGGARACHGLCVTLLAVHIEGDHLVARSADGERYGYGVVGAIAALGDAVGDIEGRRQGERHRLDGDVCLLGLPLARGRVRGGGYDIDVGRAYLQVLGEVELIGACADIRDGIAVDGGRLLVTTAVLVVVGVGEHGIAAFLDDGVVNDGGYEHLGGRGLATAATRTHREVEGGDFATALVAERDVDGRAVIADLHVA